MGILVFVIGLLIGSFLNVCIYRIPKEESIVFPGSNCPSCHQPLKAKELIPVFSWLWLRGQCRTCKTAISGRYPLVETLTGAMLVLIYLEMGLSTNFFLCSLLTMLLLMITFIDLDHQIIPDGLSTLVAFMGIVSLVYGYINNTGIIFWEAIAGIFLGGGFFLFIAIVSKGGMGGGDIKLMAALGIWFGWQGILMVMFLSFTLGGIYAVGLLVMKRKGRKEMVPFGPFIALGGYITALYGSYLWEWYMTGFFIGY